MIVPFLLFPLLPGLDHDRPPPFFMRRGRSSDTPCFPSSLLTSFLLFSFFSVGDLLWRLTRGTRFIYVLPSSSPTSAYGAQSSTPFSFPFRCSGSSFSEGRNRNFFFLGPSLELHPPSFFLFPRANQELAAPFFPMRRWGSIKSPFPPLSSLRRDWVFFSSPGE